MTPDAPEAEALAVRADRVVATGTLREMRDRFPRASVVDFQDAVIVPGFHDAHMHLMAAAEELLSVDLSWETVHSLAEVKSKLQAEAAATPAGTWIRGSRYDDAKMAEGRTLTRWDLDEVAPHHPVIVTQVAGHWAVVNSAALARARLTDEAQDPPGGVLGRDAAGHLNGILYEQALFDFASPAASPTAQPIVPPFDDEERLRALTRALTRFHAAGLTSVSEAWCPAADYALLREAKRRGLLTGRVGVLVAAEHYDALRPALASKGDDDLLRVVGVKTFIDGAIGGRTCLLEQPFEGTSDDYGIQTRTTEELRDILRRVNGDGRRFCIHANGDRAIKLVLDLMEREPHPELRNRIEHCSIVSEEILNRMAALRAMAVPFGSYVHYHGGKLLDWYGPGRVGRMFAHRWFLDAGVAVAGSSDYPCGPFEPLLAMQSCVTRTGWDRALVGVQQRVSVQEALRLYTVGAAAASGDEQRKGRLATGFLADFVVLGEDPLSVDPVHLSAIPVSATYVGGRSVWTAEDSAQ
jgi:predicted amidohydrolase YtcJ